MANNAREALAQNVKALMEIEGWKQTKLAERAGLGQRTISNLLRPKSEVSPTVDTIEAVAAAFKVPAWLLTVPGLAPDLFQNRSLATLVALYAESDAKGREDTLRIAEIAVRYNSAPSKKVS